MARIFQIFREPAGPYHAVPAGPAWLALPLPWLWAFTRRLWFRGALLLVVDALLGALVPSLLGTQTVALGLALLVPRLVALLRGHDWTAGNHEEAGYEFLGRLAARNGADAIAQVARRDGVIPDELRPRASGFAFAFPPPALQASVAVARLTVRAAFRYRLVVVLIALLLGAVVVLPMIIKHDETAQGFTQILLTYTLGVITSLLSLVTLWLACGTLARDIDECQMQVVASKPIPRWQIWLGKWTGIMALNAMLLGVSTGAVYLLMQWRATQLPAPVQQALRDNILTARASARETPPDLDARVDALLRERLPELQAKGVNPVEFRKQAFEMAKPANNSFPPTTSAASASTSAAAPRPSPEKPSSPGSSSIPRNSDKNAPTKSKSRPAPPTAPNAPAPSADSPPKRSTKSNSAPPSSTPRAGSSSTSPTAAASPSSSPSRTASNSSTPRAASASTSSAPSSSWPAGSGSSPPSDSPPPASSPSPSPPSSPPRSSSSACPPVR